MDKSTCGIVSYAGLSKEKLLSLGKAIFSQSQPPVPARFDAFLPLFPLELVQNMEYVGASEGRGLRMAPSGFSIDPTEYHRKLYAQMPELYAGDNLLRNFDYEGHFVGNSVYTVDQAWVEHFPQYQPFVGEKLSIYLIGGGFQAVAVPESVYPRGGGVLQTAEQSMQITQRAELFVQYARARVAAGDRYDAEAFMLEYLHASGLTVLTFTQKELGRAMQDISMLKNLHNDTASVGLYTENARRAERVNQYVPMRYASDLFSVEAVDKHTARLAQLYNTDNDFISDLWVPYQDLNAYVDKNAMTLDVRCFCEGYQIAPGYDAATQGGRYPDAVRVVAVRDRALRMMVGEVINNPAYGDGMGPQGTIGRQVYIADSREMIRQRKLTPEEITLSTQNTTLPPKEYRKSLSLAILQEHKGRLVDAMYRRETALSQMEQGTPVYLKASQSLDERVEKLTSVVRRESAQSGMSQMSGYDADIDYLRRKRLDREGEPEEAQTSTGSKPIAFAKDELREQSIESGYAMRTGYLRMSYAEAELPNPPAEPMVEEYGSESRATPEEVKVPEASADETQMEQPMEDGEPPKEGAPTDAEAVDPDRGDEGTNPDEVDAAPDPAEELPKDQKGLVPMDEQADGYEPHLTDEGNDRATENDATDPADVSTPEEPKEAGFAAEVEETTAVVVDGEENIAYETGASDAFPPENADAANIGVSTKETDLDSAGPSAEDEAVLPDTDDASSEGSAQENAAYNETETDFVQPLDVTATTKRFSLRELTDRLAAEVAPAPQDVPASPEEPPKPKLAFILHRGSESTAQQSYRRMSELLEKRKP